MIVDRGSRAKANILNMDETYFETHRFTVYHRMAGVSVRS
jgi:hypothetical protein